MRGALHAHEKLDNDIGIVRAIDFLERTSFRERKKKSHLEIDGAEAETAPVAKCVLKIVANQCCVLIRNTIVLEPAS